MLKTKTICNKCGKPFGQWDTEEHQHFYFDFGYESHHDGEKISFDLCGSCLDECLEMIVQTFNVVPNGWRIGDYVSLTQDQHQKVFERWKETGDWDDLMFYTYEELVDLNGFMNTEWLNDTIKKFHPDKPLLIDPHPELR